MTHAEFDETLRRLGSVQPPSGLERRVHHRLQTERPRFSLRLAPSLSAGALAASVALTAIGLVWHHPASSGLGGEGPLHRAAPPASGGFGASSVVHVPAEPVAVPPTPLNQGRGRSRSHPSSAPGPLPRGVAPAPTAPPAQQ